MFDTVGTMEINLGSTSSMMWGMIFGAIGVGYFIFGKKQARVIPLCLRYRSLRLSVFHKQYLRRRSPGILFIVLPFIISF